MPRGWKPFSFFFSMRRMKHGSREPEHLRVDRLCIACGGHSPDSPLVVSAHTNHLQVALQLKTVTRKSNLQHYSVLALVKYSDRTCRCSCSSFSCTRALRATMMTPPSSSERVASLAAMTLPMARSTITSRVIGLKPTLPDSCASSMLSGLSSEALPAAPAALASAVCCTA